MRTVSFFIVSIFFSTAVFSQNLTQRLRGTIIDQATLQPLGGATVQLTGADSIGTSTTDEGAYEFTNVSVGRYKLTVSFTGYTTSEEEVLVIAGKETRLDVMLLPSTTELNEVEVRAGLSNDLPGMHSLTTEKTLRIPANFFDPVRVATAYPGVVAASDQNNSIIVRGNSPNGLLWRLNGLDIVNPNHLANAGTLSDKPAANGGGVNILSAQMLDRTQFFMGALPTNYGNALSGVIDMRLRDGNAQKREYTAQASIIGLDLSTEGPLSSKKNSSYLFNYRYSTVGLLTSMGVDFGGEAITFQDFSFNLAFYNKHGGKTTFFGLGGLSSNDFSAKDSVDREEDKDFYNINYKAKTGAVGITHEQQVGDGYLSGGLSYSASNQERHSAIVDDTPQTVDQYSYDHEVVSGFVRYTRKVGETSTLDAGINASMINDSLFDSHLSPLYIFNPVYCPQCFTEETSGKTSGVLIQPYLNLSIELSARATLVAGIRWVRYTYNRSSVAEPRMNLTYRLSSNASIDVAYGRTSQQQQAWVYLAANNSNLGFTRADNLNLRYRQRLPHDLSFSLQGYYQYQFDVPIATNPASTYSTVNLMETDAPGNLINDGTARNYGAEFMLEKSFFDHSYFWIGGSVYDATYVAANGNRYDSRFNGRYTLTSVYGKEWTKSSRNRVIGVNARLLYLGGMRETPIDIASSQTYYETRYDGSRPYANSLGNYFRVDFRISFRKNKPGYTRTFAIDIQNLAGIQNEGNHEYDFFKNKIVTNYQLGLIPVLVYRIDF